LLFRRRQKPISGPARANKNIAVRPNLYHIDYDMMLKGSVFLRRGKPIRQFGVTVGGSTRLVTSGDVVDEETYAALIAAGAIRPVLQEEGNNPAETSKENSQIDTGK